MRIYSIGFLMICLMVSNLNAQKVICSAKDKALYTSLSEEVRDAIAKDGPSLDVIGKVFLNTPYVAKTLEIGETEALVVNLQGLDCTTYVENILAFSLLNKRDTKSFKAYTEVLEEIRYRDGVLDGYGSRLHYFTDWITNNEKKGLVEDITSSLGGKLIKKQINFMGTHRDLYPKLSADSNYKKMLAAEAEMASHEICMLSQEQIRAVEDQINGGDIIALVTNIAGLDVTHTGLATKVNGRLHLLHASSKGAVVISKKPLVDYLKGIKSNIGIIVVRAL